MFKFFICIYLFMPGFGINGSVLDIFKKARCLIPKNSASIVSTLLLQQCLAENQENQNGTSCYEELGCFEMMEPWITNLRPFPVPYSPVSIDVRLNLYTRNATEQYNVQLWPKISLNGSDYRSDRVKTVFLTHGFASNGNSSWLIRLKDAYLKNVDANIFIVDWGKGASLLNYLQVASNTRIVGAEITRFCEFLIKEGQNTSSIHLIGHSLGSHISAYVAKGIKRYTRKIGRITALDPAQPGFEGSSDTVRLDKEDASFIDVVHSDARPFIPFLGFGMLQPVGHVDYYLNGGSGQPGCNHVVFKNITSILDLAAIPVEIISQWVSCDHGRSYEVFTSALLTNNCTFWGRKMPAIETFIKVTSLGTLALLDPLVEKIEKCGKTTCTVLGLVSEIVPARGQFAVSTKSKFPYCETDGERARKIKNILTIGIYDGIAGVQEMLHKFLGKIF